jgi:protease IV
MDENNKTPRRFDLSKILKNVLLIVLILTFVPALITSVKSSFNDSLNPKERVGFLNITGFIGDAHFYIKKIQKFGKDDSIKGLVLRINSPGGYSGTCHAIFNEVKKISKKKPVVAVIENVGASGAYYIAAGANTIITSPMAMVGSIGVFMELPNVKELLTTLKVQYKLVQAGQYKTAGSMTKETTPEEQVYLQALADNQYDYFINDIAQSRKLDAASHKTWADGKVFMGTQAVALRLADKLGSMSDGIDEIKKLANLTDEVELVPAKKSSGLLKKVMGDEGDDYGFDSMSMPERIGAYASSAWHSFTVHSSQHSVQPQL